jgi:hypothetical protein
VQGRASFTLSQVALNDAIMVVAFAPLVALLLGLSTITVPWDTLLASVGLYIVVPVAVAQALRGRLLRRGVTHVDAVGQEAAAVVDVGTSGHPSCCCSRSRAGHFRAAAGHRLAGHPDRVPGRSQRWRGLPAQSTAGRRALHRRAIRADRCKQFERDQG